LADYRFTLGRTERLKSRKLIEQLFREGRHFSVFPFRAYYRLTDELPSPLQFGISASSRNFKRAVDRNRIKRWCREAYRLQKNDLQQRLQENDRQGILFLVYTGKQLPAYEVIYEKMGLILQKLSNLVSEKNSSGH
jgi:ribonuclease P protein component